VHDFFVDKHLLVDPLTNTDRKLLEDAAVIHCLLVGRREALHLKLGRYNTVQTKRENVQGSTLRYYTDLMRYYRALDSRCVFSALYSGAFANHLVNRRSILLYW